MQLGVFVSDVKLEHTLLRIHVHATIVVLDWKQMEQLDVDCVMQELIRLEMALALTVQSGHIRARVHPAALLVAADTKPPIQLLQDKLDVRLVRLVNIHEPEGRVRLASAEQLLQTKVLVSVHLVPRRKEPKAGLPVCNVLPEHSLMGLAIVFLAHRAL